MYSRKNVERRIGLWETLTLTRYSWEDFPCKTIQNRLLLRKV